MSTIVIVSVCAAIAAVIGLRVYFEHKEERELENSSKEDVFSDLQAFVINPTESTITPAVVEQENQHVADTQVPAIVNVEPINSPAGLAETKPKKKRYYYPKKKKAAIKAKPKNKS